MAFASVMRLLVATLVCCAACLPRVGPAVSADGGELPGDGGGTLADGGPDSCADSLLDGLETAVDCGGPDCAPCATGLGCHGPLDCASSVCVNGTCRVAAAPACPTFAGCVTFLDATADLASRVVTFPAGGDRYQPKCLKVKLGQTVTFSGGSFDTHPLEQACGPTAGTVVNTTPASSASFTFDSALGVYGYYCNQHGSSTGGGMAGAIEVVR